MLKFVSLFAFCTFVMNVVNAQTELSEEDIIKFLFNSTYKYKRPPVISAGEQGPVNVTVNLYLRNIYKIDDIKNDYDVQLTYRQRWRDESLTYNAGSIKSRNYINLPNPSNYVWLPDTFFSNEIGASYPDLMVRNEYLRIYPNGDVIHNTRINLKLWCHMIFRNFPFDKQTCSIRIANYAHTNTDINYRWQENDPVQVTSDLLVPNFHLYQFVADYCDSQTNTGYYSCLRVDFNLKREIFQYFMNLYIPVGMMVTVVCLSFWIDSRAILARIGLVAGTLFLCTALIISLNQTFPVSSYPKAVDIWNVTCLTFIFFALVETIVVQYIENLENEKKSKMSGESVGDNQIEVELKTSKAKSEKKCAPKFCFDAGSVSKKVDKAFRVVFPVSFVIFSYIYFQYYRRDHSTN